MCGFAALIARRFGDLDHHRLVAMGTVLSHRGPDDEGLWSDGRVGFAFRRLAILDLSPAGHQPMQSEDGQFTLVFNGEIYNHGELRRELESLGHRFRSTSDSEVLLRAYMQWGDRCLARFNGMWAFLIHDRVRGVVFGSRDRFGIKPLYWAHTTAGLAVASEIKALRVAGAGAVPDWARVSEWLIGPNRQQLPPDGRTFFAGVYEVPAASAFEIAADGRRRDWTYWSLDGIERRERADAGEQLSALLVEAVRLQGQADVPVGVSLSGGLDSTLITCVLAQQSDAPIETFCYLSEEHDERTYIRDTIAQTGARLNVVDVDPRCLMASLDELLAMHDEPVHTLSAAIGSEIMRVARARGLKVMLSGQGADEVLAGYPSYFEEYWLSLALARDPRLESEVRAWCALHGGDPAVRLAEVRRRCQRVRLRRTVPGYDLASRWWRRRQARCNPWYRGVVRDALPLPSARPALGLSAALHESVVRDPLPLYLRIEDRNAMAHGVEGRVPFLDHRVVEFAFSLPEGELLRGPWTKHVLREAMRGRTPTSVHQRPDKIGFGHPRRTWFRNVLARPLADMLADPAAPELYDVPRIRADLERHRRGEINCAVDLFNFAQLERWLTHVVPMPSRPTARREVPIRLIGVLADRGPVSSIASVASAESIAVAASVVAPT
jgi:asparagine synthase (glutamine-hydrolysing)